jgi:AraC-like DNA-binding protein
MPAKVKRLTPGMMMSGDTASAGTGRFAGALMSSAPGQASYPVCRFSTDDVPSAKRLTFWRETFAQSAVRAHVDPRSTGQFKARVLLERMPGLSVMSLASTAASIDRTAKMLDDGDDALALVTPQQGKQMWAQCGREVILRPGQGVLLLHREPVIVTHGDGCFRAFIVPRVAVAGAVRNLEDSVMRLISADTPALRLLLHYASGILAESVNIGDRARSVVGSHVQDLIAAVAARDAESLPAKTADASGVRAARLAAMKEYVISRIGEAEVTVGDLAAWHRVTPRTVQRLFEDGGSTFSMFKLEQQLVFAQRLLHSDRDAYPTIADIAYAAGFSDLSYFHRSFRRRFGITPAEYREHTRDTLSLAHRE